MITAVGIADGRSLADALIRGLQGINIDTRSLPSVQTAVSQNWKDMMISAASEDTIKAAVVNHLFPAASKNIYKEYSPQDLRTSLLHRGMESTH